MMIRKGMANEELCFLGNCTARMRWTVLDWKIYLMMFAQTAWT